MADDVVINKAAIVERCLSRIRQVHAENDANLLTDLTRQDSILLNLQRACEASIDLAIVRSIVRERLVDFEAFTRHALRHLAEAK